MGASNGKGKEELDFNIDNFSIKNENKVKEGENITLKNSKILFEKSEKSICEIITDKGYGTGFFCIIKYPNKYNEIYCLITNNHVITKNMLTYQENIEIKLNNKEIKISLSKNRRIWTNEEIDFTCIEIIKEDDIIEIINPFEIDYNCYNIKYNIKEYDKRGIIIPGIKEKEIEMPQGIIYYIKNEELFLHNCNTEDGFSGGPIILINNLKIIGIHKGYEENNNKNIGIYFKKILEKINEEKENIINCILDIKLNQSEIIIFNENENNKKEIKDNVNVYIENKRINIINEENKWKIDYKFEKKGKYNMKIIIKNNIKDMNGFFENCSNVYSIDLSNFDTSKVINMGWMFNECHKLKEIEGINKFNTNQVTNMKAMFNECNELEYLDLSNFDTSKVNDMGWMFNECHKLKEIKGINEFDTNQVTNMKAMFNECNELEYLDLSNFDTSKINNMEEMFNKCYKLKEIKGINKFNTNQVINMSTMFQECNELKYLDLSNFDTSKVNNMGFMFNKCHKLKEIKGINKFNTNQVTNMSTMFQLCNELEYLDLSNFDTSKVNDMGFMFNKCYKLREIKGINKFNTNQVTNMNTMFQLCNELEYLDLSNFVTSKVNNMEGMFNQCYKLKYLNISNFSLNNKCITTNIFQFIDNHNCLFFANDIKLKNLFQQNN